MDLEELLIQKGIFYTRKNNQLIVKCFSGLHEDNNPSLHFSLDKNVFNCFSCGFKGNIKDFCDHLGFKGPMMFTTKLPFKIQKIKDKLKQIVEPSVLSIPNDAIYCQTSFRNINEETIKEFKGFYTNLYDLIDYINFPIYQFNKLKFIESRHKISQPTKDIPKYLRNPKNINIANILTPYDKIKNFSTIILVEGFFDMLNLWQFGYTNTLSILGANNFSQKKAEILNNSGTERVIIMMDGDSAGKRAAENIFKILTEKYNIDCLIITLEEHQDPGGLTQEEISNYIGQP